MTYDEDRRTVVVFGGKACSGAVLGDLWEYDGITWTQRQLTPAPSARARAALAYDRARHRLVLFGGHSSSATQNVGLGDTWELGPSGWVDVTADAGVGPSPRATHLTYDTARHVSVAFSGGPNPNGSNLLGETWEYDGVWTRRNNTNNPTSRLAAGFAYDPLIPATVVIAGFNGGPIGNVSIYDGTTWTGRNVNGQPTDRYDLACAFDPLSGRVLSLGGRDNGFAHAGVLGFDNGDWLYFGNLPDPRDSHAAAFDEARRVLVIFGGATGTSSCTNDTLEY